MQNVAPQAVIDFAVEHGFTNGVKYIGVWNDFTVYLADFTDMPEKSVWGLPQYILKKGEYLRWANYEEIDELMDL